MQKIDLDSLRQLYLCEVIRRKERNSYQINNLII